MQAAAGFLGMTSDGLEDVGPAISERTSSDQTASTSYAASEVDSAAEDSSMATGRSRAKYVQPHAASCGQGCAHHAANLPTQVLWHGQACLQHRPPTKRKAKPCHHRPCHPTLTCNVSFSMHLLCTSPGQSRLRPVSGYCRQAQAQDGQAEAHCQAYPRSRASCHGSRHEPVQPVRLEAVSRACAGHQGPAGLELGHGSSRFQGHCQPD